MIENIFNKEESVIIKIISNIAKEYGFNIFLVGGMVRDALLGKKSKDIDIVFEGDVFFFKGAIDITGSYIHIFPR